MHTYHKQYGLYSGFMACFVYVVFGTSKDMSLGPTAILSLLTASLTAQLGDDAESRVPYAIALTLLSGIVQVLLGIFNLGELGVYTLVRLYESCGL